MGPRVRRASRRAIYLICAPFIFFVYLCLARTAQTDAENLFGPSSDGNKLDFLMTNSKGLWCQFISHSLKFLREKKSFDNIIYPSGSDNVALLVAYRGNLAHFWCIPWTMHMLGPKWKLQIITRRSEVPLFKSILSEFNMHNNYFLDTFEDLYGYGPWITELFMRRVQFMVSTQFWEGIRGENILIIQDHGVPLRKWDSPQVEPFLHKLFQYGYAGAPWDLDEDRSPGGNGGFSFRRRSFLMRYAINASVPVSELLAEQTDLSPVGSKNEDGVLGPRLRNHPNGVAPKVLEHQFACEKLLHPRPMGVHDLPRWHNSTETLSLIIVALQELLEVVNPVVVSSQFEPGYKSWLRPPWLQPWIELQERFPGYDLPRECNPV